VIILRPSRIVRVGVLGGAGSILFLALAAVAAGSCVEEKATTQDVVSLIPWPDVEMARYVLRERDEDGENRGNGVLSIRREGEQYRLGLRFEDGSNSDESDVLVEAETLKPLYVYRQIITSDERSVVEGQYEEDVVQITSRTDGRERSSPLRLKEHHYENESSLFLWRTLPFDEGYRASYRTVLVNRRAQQVVEVKVVGRESVIVPAGTFEAWRVEVRSGGVEQVAWYADTETRTLVKYDNSELLFLLTEG
jgi:hypothetical protein